jgi:XTP/dITP diphosphohydrolase
VRLLIATTNPGKIREFREMLGGDRFTWDDLSTHQGLSIPEETGSTFRGNACLKASHYAKLLKTFAVADDSGLEVDALDGRPGIHSARWAELHRLGQGDIDNNSLLLQQLNDVPDGQRSARFVCVLALADEQGRILLTARDTVEGRILREARGTNGFGYDPLFLIDEMGQTTAQLAPEEKHRVSHRGKALRRLRALMDKSLE